MEKQKKWILTSSFPVQIHILFYFPTFLSLHYSALARTHYSEIEISIKLSVQHVFPNFKYSRNVLLLIEVRTIQLALYIFILLNT